VLTPVRAPNANAIAERVIGTIRRECLDHVLVFNERHLSFVLAEFVSHYNRRRPHRSLSLDAPDRRIASPRFRGSRRLRRRAILGGLINEYEWAA